jgi:hypothetical protein
MLLLRGRDVAGLSGLLGGRGGRHSGAEAPAPRGAGPAALPDPTPPLAPASRGAPRGRFDVEVGLRRRGKQDGAAAAKGQRAPTCGKAGRRAARAAGRRVPAASGARGEARPPPSKRLRVAPAPAPLLGAPAPKAPHPLLAWCIMWGSFLRDRMLPVTRADSRPSTCGQRWRRGHGAGRRARRGDGGWAARGGARSPGAAAPRRSAGRSRLLESRRPKLARVQVVVNGHVLGRGRAVEVDLGGRGGQRGGAKGSARERGRHALAGPAQKHAQAARSGPQRPGGARTSVAQRGRMAKPSKLDMACG